MHLRRPLSLHDARLEHFSLTPAKDTKGVLSIVAPLSSEDAETLGVDFMLNGTVVREVLGKSVPLAAELQDTVVTLPQSVGANVTTTYYPEIIQSLRLIRVEGGTFELRMNVHVAAGSVHDAVSFALSCQKDTFSVVLGSRQGDLSFDGGTRVTLSDRPRETPPTAPGVNLFQCDSCDREIPMNEDATVHVDPATGAQTLCTHPSAAAVRDVQRASILPKNGGRRGRPAAEREPAHVS